MTLVTGAAGFIGSHLTEALLARGEKVRALIRRSSSTRYLPSMDLCYGDLVRGDGLPQALAGVGTVFHVAGVTKALRPQDYHAGNVQASETLARAAAGQGIRFVHVSSLAAMGPNAAGTPLTEDAPARPFTRYGQSKLEAERVVRAAVPDAVIVRPPVVYGPRDSGVFQVLKPISRGWALEIAGGERWFSAIYVQDLVEGLIAAAASPVAAGRVYFLAHPKPVSWSELTAAAARIMHRQPRVLRIPAPVARAVGLCAELWAQVTRRPAIVSRAKVAEAQCPAWTCDPRRAAAELGFQAHTVIEDGLAETLAWYKEAGWIRY